MNNKFKKSKYAAIFLASTMALSTVVTAAPAAFDDNAITAHAAEAATGDAVTTLIDSLDVTKTDFDASVDAADTAYNALSADEKKNVTAATIAKLASYKAIKSAGVASILASDKYPTAANLTVSDTNKIDTYTETVSGTPDVKEKTDKKGNKVTVGKNTKLDSYVENLTAFKTAYDKAAANKGAKTILTEQFKTYQGLLKTATALQAKVEANYDAKAFNDVLKVTKTGGTYNVVSDKALKVDKKGGFTLDGDKFKATLNTDGTISVVDSVGAEVTVADGEITVENVDEDDFSAVVTAGSELLLAGDTYEVTIDGTEASFKLGDTTTKSVQADGKTTITLNNKLYNVVIASGTVTLTVEKSDATFKDKYTIVSKAGSFEIKKVLEVITIGSADKDAIKLHGLDKGLDVAAYKKLKAGKGKYNDSQIEVINGLDAAYKATSSAGKKAISAEDLKTYKDYVADVKTQTTLEKKLASSDTKGVSDKISKLKYSTNTAAYAKSIEEARSAYDALSNKYKKKMKAAVVSKLTAQEAAITEIKKIEALPVKDLAVANTEGDVAAVQAKVDKVAKTIKGNKNGGTGSYYDLTKSARSYVKNFKEIATLNKAITAQLAYVKQKEKVDVFEKALTAVTGDQTVRIVNNYVALGGTTFKVVTDKKTKQIVLQNTVENQASFTLEAGATLKVLPAELKAAEYTGNKSIKVGTTTYAVTYAASKATLTSGNDTSISVENDKEVKLSDVTYKAKVTSDSVTLTKVVEKEVNEGTVKPVEGTVALNGSKLAVTAASDKAAGFYSSTGTALESLTAGDQLVRGSELYVAKETSATDDTIAFLNAKGEKIVPKAGDTVLSGTTKYVYKDVEKGFKVGSTVVYNGDILPISSKEYIVAIDASGNVTFTDQFDPETVPGYIVKNTKGALSITENQGLGLSAIDFKGVTAEALIAGTASVFSTADLTAIAAATKANATVSTNKDAKKQINKVDTTTLKAFETSVKAQKGLENKVLAKYGKDLKYSTDLVITDETTATIISKYESDATAAQAALATYVANNASEKSKIEKTYKTKFDNHTAAAKVATKVLLLPTVADLTVDDKDQVEAARVAYKALKADQVKLVSATAEIITKAEDQIKLLEAQEAAVAGSATAEQYTLLGIEGVTTSNITALGKLAKATAEANEDKTTAEKVVAIKVAIKDVLAAQTLINGKTVTFEVLADSTDKAELLKAIQALDTATTKNSYVAALKVDDLAVKDGKVTVTLAEGLTAEVTVQVKASALETAAKTLINGKTVTLASDAEVNAATVLSAIQALDTATTNTVVTGLVEGNITLSNGNKTATVTLPSGDKAIVTVEVEATTAP